MADQWVVPPGQEAVIGAMLGSSGGLPGDCKLDSGNVEKTTIKATYACPTGEVIVELAHPAAAPAKAERTAKFALWVERGTPPPDLQSALSSRIRESEGQFQWILQPEATPAPALTPTRMLSSALVLGAFLLAALLLWRRRTRTTQG
jgi:hypothetical protein